MTFSEDIVQKVWEKGQIVSENNPNVWRKDECEAWIHRASHGNRDSVYGWEVDHINPNGGDDISNLRPLQWINNAEKSEGRLTCPVVSDGIRNVRR